MAIKNNITGEYLKITSMQYDFDKGNHHISYIIFANEEARARYTTGLGDYEQYKTGQYNGIGIIESSLNVDYTGNAKAQLYNAGYSALKNDMYSGWVDVFDSDTLMTNEFLTALFQKKATWNNKLKAGYLSPATGVQMSLTTSVIDGQNIFDKAVLLAIDIPAKLQAGMPNTTPYSMRGKDGSLIPNSTLGMAYNYLLEITKIGAKVQIINGLIFDAKTEAELDAIDLDFEWNSILA